MLELVEYQQSLAGLAPEIEELEKTLDTATLQAQLEILDEKAAAPDFWNDSENSQKVLQQSKEIRDKLSSFTSLKSLWSDTLELAELAIEMEDSSVLSEVASGTNKIKKELDAQKLSALLTGEYDANNAIMSFHAGAGGTEAQDWAEMLYRMYTRWAEQKGYAYEVLNYLDGEEAGLKSATILIKGLNAYGFLKSEAGVHRLVRVSPFDSSGRRHTSFASIEVMPEVEDIVDIDIAESDLRVDTYRASGAGGQHVNMTDSAVRITHLPTGVVTSCQNERSQHQNREVAMKMLVSKLVEIKEREHLDKIEDIRGEHKEIAWGSQIRSYVFMPYTLVKDHRTGEENGNVDAVMNGEIDSFINAYLIAESKKKN